MAERRIVDIGMLLESANEVLNKAVLESNMDRVLVADEFIKLLESVPVLTKEELYDYVKGEYAKSWKP